MRFKKPYLLIAYIIVILVFSFISAQDLGSIYSKTGITSDNIIHFAVFFILGFVMCRYFSQADYRSPRLYSAALGTTVAVVIEVVQLFIHSRHSQSFDLFLHFIAVVSYCVLEWVIIEIWYRLRRE